VALLPGSGASEALGGVSALALRAADVLGSVELRAARAGPPCASCSFWDEGVLLFVFERAALGGAADCRFPLPPVRLPESESVGAGARRGVALRPARDPEPPGGSSGSGAGVDLLDSATGVSAP
jgi:hypothetical protein